MTSFNKAALFILLKTFQRRLDRLEMKIDATAITPSAATNFNTKFADSFPSTIAVTAVA
jgi:hypothetical protein